MNVVISSMLVAPGTAERGVPCAVELGRMKDGHRPMLRDPGGGEGGSAYAALQGSGEHLDWTFRLTE